MRKTTSGLETVGEWERQEQAQKRDPSAGHSGQGVFMSSGKPLDSLLLSINPKPPLPLQLGVKWVVTVIASFVQEIV